MNSEELKPRLFHGTTALINNKLQAIGQCSESFDSKTMALKLSAIASPGSGLTSLIFDVFEIIRNNWELGGKENRSKESWRWKPQIVNKGLRETKWERILVECANRMSQTPRWTNQIPTGSGMSPKGETSTDVEPEKGSACDGCGHIDLAYLNEQGGLMLIEFKINSDNPVYAALQLIRYALVFVLARESGHLIDKAPWKDATEVDLRVLAAMHYPCADAKQFYDKRYKLAWFENRLNEAISVFGKQYGLQLSFAYRSVDWREIDNYSESKLQLLDCLNGPSPFLD